MTDWVARAKAEDPGGSICTFCGEDNDNADDCGWWYLTPNGPHELNGPACNECSDSGLLKKHQARYGVGER